MGKEAFERKCIEDLLKMRCGKETKKYLSQLSGYELDETWEESPDFLFRKDDSVIGIEHFVVDMFPQENRAGSRMVYEQQSELFTEHHDSLMQDTFDDKKACTGMENLLQTQMDMVSTFNYDSFLNEFSRIVYRHGKKIDRYVERLNAQKPSDMKLFFLVEMRHVITQLYSKNFPVKCIRKDGAAVLKHRLTQIPFTFDFLNIFKTFIGKVNGIIIMSYEFNDAFNGLTNISFIDLKDENAMYEGLCKQKIEIYKSFSYEFPKVKIKLYEQ